MIEEYIKQHIKEKLAEAYPEFPEDQVLIRVTGGDIRYEKKTREYLGTEVLQAAVIMSNDIAFNRQPFLEAFLPRGGIMLEGVRLWQEYKRHERTQNVESGKNTTVVFYLEYKYDIEKVK